MKKRIRFPRFFCSAVLALGILSSLLLSGCTVNKAEPVVPPMRMAEYPSEANFGYMPASIAGEIADSDAVACVRIGDWLGYTKDMYSSLYSVETVETVKGSLPAKFTLIQDGSSKFTLEGHPLFTAGNELLLFLRKTTDEANKQYELTDETYTITCAQMTTFDIVSVESEEYAVPRHYALLETMPASVHDLAQDNAFLKKAVDGLIRSDNIWEKVNTKPNHVYRLDELIRAIKEA